MRVNVIDEEHCFGHSLPTSRLFKRKKTKTFGLALSTYNLGRVAHFVRNPALPKDQPLRGSWHNEFLLSRTRSIILPAYWSPFLFQYAKLNSQSTNISIQTNQQKKTKTYGLMSLDAPLKLGRSLP